MNRSNEVDAWLEVYDNPMKEVVERVRDVLLHSDPRIEERLERDAPTYSYRGDLANFFPLSKKHASLMFPRGGEIPGHHPRLEGSDGTGRVMKMASVAEANAARDDLQHVVRSWCEWRDADAAASEPVEAPAKKAAAKKKAAKKPAAKKPGAKKAAARKKAAPKKKGAKATAKKAEPAAKKRAPKASGAKRPAKAAPKRAQGKNTRSRGR